MSSRKSPQEVMAKSDKLVAALVSASILLAGGTATFVMTMEQRVTRLETQLEHHAAQEVETRLRQAERAIDRLEGAIGR